MFDRIRVSSLALALGVAVLAATAVPQLKASEIDKKTVMTFSGPVQISGQTLPAGTYVFRTLQNNNSEVVIVTNKDENRVIGTFLTIPAESLTVSDKTRVEFGESPSNSPEAIHAWFYPGDDIGWEFLTPKTGRNAAHLAD